MLFRKSALISGIKRLRQILFKKNNTNVRIIGALTISKCVHFNSIFRLFAQIVFKQIDK